MGVTVTWASTCTAGISCCVSASLPAVALELTEGLEQLRALHYGFRIRVVDVVETGVEVDMPDDLERAEAYWSRLQLGAAEECHG